MTAFGQQGKPSGGRYMMWLMLRQITQTILPKLTLFWGQTRKIKQICVQQMRGPRIHQRAEHHLPPTG